MSDQLNQMDSEQLSLFDVPSSGTSTPAGFSTHSPVGETRLVTEESDEKNNKSFWEQNVQPSIDQVEVNADQDWRDVARDCLHTLAETLDELTADDLVQMLESKHVEVETHNLAALGPIFLRGRAAGWIENTGRMVRTRIARRHRKITVWKSLLRSNDGNN